MTVRRAGRQLRAGEAVLQAYIVDLAARPPAQRVQELQVKSGAQLRSAERPRCSARARPRRAPAMRLGATNAPPSS